MQQNSAKYREEDEIDLRELFKTLMKWKKFIIIFTVLVTISAIIYVLMKNPVPVYSGSVMLEIGEVKTPNATLSYMDNPRNLKIIIEKKYSVTALLPKKTDKLIIILYSSKDKKEIEKNIDDAVDYILNRHKEKAKLFDKYIMTKQIGDMIINPKPINQPKKKLIVIVAFITGLVLSIFLIFFLEFIRNEEKEEGNK